MVKAADGELSMVGNYSSVEVERALSCHGHLHRYLRHHGRHNHLGRCSLLDNCHRIHRGLCRPRNHLVCHCQNCWNFHHHCPETFSDAVAHICHLKDAMKFEMLIVRWFAIVEITHDCLFALMIRISKERAEMKIISNKWGSLFGFQYLIMMMHLHLLCLNHILRPQYR